MSKFKTIRSVGHGGSILIFVKKRVVRKVRLGLIPLVYRWEFVLGKDGLPVVFNHQEQADLFVEGKIKYREWAKGFDMIHEKLVTED